MQHYEHYARWGACSVCDSKRKTCHDITQGSAGAGPGQEVSHRKLGEADFAMALTGCGRAAVKECELHLVTELAGALMLLTCSLHKLASLIPLYN